MSSFSHQNNTSTTVTVTRTLSNRASFYAASINDEERFERLGSGQELDWFGTSVARSSLKAQMEFVRKVFLISLIQSLIITTLMTVFIHFLSHWQEQRYLWWVISFPAMILSIVALWQLYTQYYQLSIASRVLLLVLYSLLMAFILADLASGLFHEYGLIVATMSSFGLLSVVLYTCQTKFIFKGPKPIFCCVATMCVSSIGLRELYQLNPIQILAPLAMSSVICAYFVLDLYYVIEMMTVDDYILAYISFHIDLAYPINCIHHVCEISDHVDDFPEYFNPNYSTSRG